MNMNEGPNPSGFILSDAAMYAFQCQEVYPDLLSFASAIPDHLKPLFLIPVYVQTASEPSDALVSIAARIASPRQRQLTEQSLPTGDVGVGDVTPNRFVPEGTSDASELFGGYSTFDYHDNEPNMPPAEEGSINDAYQMPDTIPATQPQDQFCGGEPRYDARVWGPDSTSYMTDGDSTDLFDEGYPYRSEQQVRHSSQLMPVRVHIAIKPEVLQEHAPDKIQENALSCTARFISYQKPTRMYTFSVHCGNVPHMVRAVLSEIDEITMTCDCPFWRWGGPEYHAKQNEYILGNPRGTAAPPNVRDPERRNWLCKHAYAVLRHLERHVQKVVDEHWELDDEDLLNVIDAEWDRLSEEAATPMQEIEEQDPEVVEPESEEEPEEEPEPEPEPEEEPELEEPAEQEGEPPAAAVKLNIQR